MSKFRFVSPLSWAGFAGLVVVLLCLTIIGTLLSQLAMQMVSKVWRTPYELVVFITYAIGFFTLHNFYFRHVLITKEQIVLKSLFNTFCIKNENIVKIDTFYRYGVKFICFSAMKTMLPGQLKNQEGYIVVQFDQKLYNEAIQRMKH